MNIDIERIINKPIESNCFVLYQKERSNCVIIDPGDSESLELIDFLNKKGLIPEFIILTHEHFDHIWGVNKIKNVFGSKIVCSSICSENIISKKKNMSVFYNQIGFETYPSDLIVNNDSTLKWNDSLIHFIKTPGHTEGSICILIDNSLFTGDTIIKNHKTVVKLLGGSLIKLKESLNFLNDKFLGKGIMIHSGHGDSFFYDELNIKELVNE